MAAIVRGARAGRGGHGRAEGRQRGPAVHHAAHQVNDRVAPPNHQWLFWKRGNENRTTDQDDEEGKIYRFLEKCSLVDPMELVRFGVPQGLLPQPPGVLTMLRGLVDLYNWMMPIRQRYLYKHINGEWGKEMSNMEKTLLKGVGRADEKIKAIKDAGGYCPPRPKLFDALPKRKE